jgi:hypothetical protein
MKLKLSRMAALAVIVAVAATALAACGTDTTATPKAPADGTGTTGSTGGTTEETAPDFKTLLTLEEAKQITGRTDLTEADVGIRQGDSEYLVIYTGVKFPDGLWLRVGGEGMFEEARSAYGQGKETKLDGLGEQAFLWDTKEQDAGVAFRAGGRTYIISTKYIVPDQTTMKMEPAATQQQLMDAAMTVAGKLE